MNLSVRQLPYEPCFYRSEKELTAFRLFPCFRYIFEYPSQFGAAEIRIYEQACLLSDFFIISFCCKLVAVFRCPATLPYDSIVNRYTCFLIPYDSRFSLICDAYRLDVLVCTVYFQQSFLCHTHLCGPYLHGIMLYPTRFRVNLRKLFLCHAYNISFFVINNAA